MKITIYELLGLIKEGKAPRSILFKGDVWFWGYDTYTTIGCLNDTPDAQYSMFSKYRIDYCLNDEVEIIEDAFTGCKWFARGKEIMSMEYPNEEEKDIEEIEDKKPIQELKNKRFTRNQKQIAGKINEVIRALNELKNKGD